MQRKQKQSHLIHYQVVITLVSIATLWNGGRVLAQDKRNEQFIHIFENLNSLLLITRVLRGGGDTMFDTFNNIKIQVKRLSLT